MKRGGGGGGGVWTGVERQRSHTFSVLQMKGGFSIRTILVCMVIVCIGVVSVGVDVRASDDDNNTIVYDLSDVIDGGNVLRMIKTLASCCNAALTDQYNDDSDEYAYTSAVTRVVFSPEDLKAREVIRSWMLELDLIVREDAIGNIFGEWVGSGKDNSGSVLTGSHIDALPLAGAYDGVLGVVGALEAIRALKAINYVPVRSIEIIMFTSEEPTRFGLSCLGSRVMSGALDSELAGSLVGQDGLDIVGAMRQAGYHGHNVMRELDESIDSGSREEDAASLHEVFSRVQLESKNRFSAFVELHIEQGPLLERNGDVLGVVGSIAAPSYRQYHFHALGGHAGALMMEDRHGHDALLAAAELALSVEEAALKAKKVWEASDDNDSRSSEYVGTVATVGRIDVTPGAVNSVARLATVHVDVRDDNSQRRDDVVNEIEAAATRIAKQRGVTLKKKQVTEDPAMISDKNIVNIIEDVAEKIKIMSQEKANGAQNEEAVFKWRRMVSRAYHDSTFMSMIAPSAMIFIPCKGGVSHRPDEFSSKQDMEVGVLALAMTLRKLSSSIENNINVDDEL